MNNKVKNIAAIVVVVIGSLTMTAHAHKRCSRHVHVYRAHYKVPVMRRPIVVSHVSNRFSQADRLKMAIAFIKKEGSINAQQYSKITGLKRDVAQAELDAFANDKECPISLLLVKKKRAYVL